MLSPVYQLLFHEWRYLILTEDQVTISYKTYKTDDESDMQEIIEQNLAPGRKKNNCQIILKYFLKILLSVASVAQGHPGKKSISHAMVLDTYDKDRDLLIFKNTFDGPTAGRAKKFKIKRTHKKAPKELYFVHIEVRVMENLPSQRQRGADKKAESEKKVQQYSAMTDNNAVESATSDGQSSLSSQQSKSPEDQSEQ